jgi:hypothetical protein
MLRCQETTRAASGCPRGEWHEATPSLTPGSNGPGRAAIALAILPSQVAAALLWTLTPSPLTATTGVSTTFTLVGTNGDPLLSEIGCIRVTVPSASVEGASIVSTSNGRTWLSMVSGNTVWVRSQDGGGRLALLQSVTFRIQATPLGLGAYTWSSNAYTQQDCSGTGSLLGVPPVVVVAGAAATPSPTPRPTPTPTPKPTPARPAPVADGLADGRVEVPGLQALPDIREEVAHLRTIEHAMVERAGHIHHRADGDHIGPINLDDHRSLDDRLH